MRRDSGRQRWGHTPKNHTPLSDSESGSHIPAFGGRGVVGSSEGVSESGRMGLDIKTAPAGEVSPWEGRGDPKWDGGGKAGGSRQLGSEDRPGRAQNAFSATETAPARALGC